MRSFDEAILTVRFATKLVPATLRTSGKDSVLIGGSQGAGRVFDPPKKFTIDETPIF